MPRVRLALGGQRPLLAAGSALLALALACGEAAEPDRTYHANGRLESEAQWVVGSADEHVRHGAFTAWYANGTQRARGAFWLGEQDGPWKQWHENGVLGSEGRWVRGAKVGPWRYYQEDGRIVAEGAYRDGKEEGRWRTWHANGAPRAAGSFLFGAREGVWIERDEDGALDAERSGVYSDGAKVGDLPRVSDLAAVEAAWSEADAIRGEARP